MTDEFKSRFDGVDLGSSRTLRLQVQSSVRRRHEDLQDAITLLRKRGLYEAANVIEAMIEAEKAEVNL